MRHYATLRGLMMNNEKVLELVNIIEATLRELAEITGEHYISTFVMNGSFHLCSDQNENGQTILNFYRSGGENNDTIIQESTTDGI